MSGLEYVNRNDESQNGSSATNTPSNYAWPSSRRQSTSSTDGFGHPSSQTPRQNSVDVTPDEYGPSASIRRPDGERQQESSPPGLSSDVPQRPRPALKPANAANNHRWPDGANPNVRFGSQEKGDGRQSTLADGYPGPLRISDLEAINEKLSEETELEHAITRTQTQSEAEAYRLVRYFMNREQGTTSDEPDLESGRSTPRPLPREGLLSMLLRLNNRPGGQSGASTPLATPGGSPPESAPSSGMSTPRHFFPFHTSHSNNSLSALLSSSSRIAIPTAAPSSLRTDDFSRQVNERLAAIEQEQKRPRRRENWKQPTKETFKRLKKRKDKHKEVRTLIAETIDKQHYIVTLCRALIRYGAPTHRLEAYMRISADALGIGGQFLYIPGCMIISFDDENTHTAEVKLVRENQNVDLGRMDSCHNIYKQVAKGTLPVREGHELIKELMRRPPHFARWKLVIMYGFAAASVGPFAFGARPIDIPAAFFLGLIVGFLQYYVNPVSELWQSCFTVLAPLITSALARVLGSIGYGKSLCFSALAQSSIALILPGYTVLCAALELQSGAMVAGSIRLVYAIIYSLFLGFGITIGTAIVGAIWTDAVSATTCPHPITNHWFFLAVPVFTLCLTIINQAKWKQAPVQMVISLAGYQVNYWVSQYVKTPSVSNAAGACAIGLLANMYARFGYHHEQQAWAWYCKTLKPRIAARLPRRPAFLRPKKTRRAQQDLHYDGGVDTPTEGVEDGTFPLRSTRDRVTYGLAAAAMLPAIWVQVPSGLSVGGSLISGVDAADQITSNATSSASTASGVATSEQNTAVLMVAFSVVQIAIGITVGLFISTVIVYPRGKKGGGVFTM